MAPKFLVANLRRDFATFTKLAPGKSAKKHRAGGRGRRPAPHRVDHLA